MLYKEWQTAKIKCLIWLVIYLGASAVFSLTYNGGFYTTSKIADYSDPFPNPNPRFQSWIGITALLMVVVAALGGVDLVAEEKANSTLGFLLTKPVSRGRIYFSKILVNSLALGAAFLPGNLLILLADQLKPIPILHFYQVEGPAGALCGEFQACFSQKYEFIYHSFDILPALWVLGLILMFGVGIVCLSGLVSIFARNTMQAILLTIPGLAVFLVIVINTLGGGGRIVNAASFSTMNPLTPLLLAGAIIVFFYSGLAAFRRKEF